ncbi:S8 family serine peptidase [Tessaracoccus sp. OH4464_COT-324]|uniref:S8 family serine peptidase n=1 Tax=Tessaracoccus sp. OH4464_COT-324 TaxID=2491059 RepID=UPI000F6431BF|nr:S8 family serine peptidase [Tessaracoccus sp. OH4464_COT-324]RRD46191.1 hypothetical protein EII42_08365 [Tessaracoccus sp. OH4464_COT-324]
MSRRRFLAGLLALLLTCTQLTLNAHAEIVVFTPYDCAAAKNDKAEKPPKSWHIDRMRLEELHHVATGRGVKVAVIDTGAAIEGTVYLKDGDRSRFVHYDGLGGRKSYDDSEVLEYDCVHGTVVVSLLAAGKKPDGQPYDEHVDFYGVAPEAEVVLYRTLMRSGKPEPNDPPVPLSPLTEAIRDATRKGVDVINISQAFYGDLPGKGEMEIAIKEAIDAGVVVVAAAGNKDQGNGQDAYPGAFPGVISVGASNINDAPSEQAQTGGKVDIGAPGEGLVALAPSRRDETAGMSSQVYALNQVGSSFATPIVSGVVALMIEKHRLDIQNGVLKSDAKLTPAEIRKRIVLTADPPPRSTSDLQLGGGIINPVRLLSGDAGSLSNHKDGPPINPPVVLPEERRVDQVPIVVGIAMGVAAVMMVVAGLVLAIVLPAAKRARAAERRR